MGLTAPAWAGFDEGTAAYQRGDYATALREFRPLAEQGAADAQFNLGVMYFKGRGVPQVHAEAVKWYRKAAEQGVAKAQYNLGHMYSYGLGVPQDQVQAHMWFSLADAGKHRDYVASLMTPEQIAEAQRLAREWKRKRKKK